MRPATITRHILQGRTAAPVATTATAAAAGQAYYAMIMGAWREAARTPDMPPHNWAQSGLSPAYDAAKYCGDYAAGAQHAYATAVCYTLAVPQDALSGAPCHITSLAARIYGDRWLADGAILTAVFSDSAEPPDWGAMLAVGHHSEVVMATTPSNTGPDAIANISFAWETDNAAPQYIHLVLRLADYLTVRGAWIEGSALLDANSIAMACDREVAADPGSEPPDPAMALANLVVPLRLHSSAARTPYTYIGAQLNLDSQHMRLHWAADMLRGGHGVAGPADGAAVLTPIVSAAGLNVSATGHIARCWCPVASVSGNTAWFRAVGTLPPRSALRISLHCADGSGNGPDHTKPDTWLGDGAMCLGSAVFAAVKVGDWLGVPLRRSATGEVWVACCIDAVACADGPVGDAASGISLIDAHIAAQPVRVVPVPHFVGIGPQGSPLAASYSPHALHDDYLAACAADDAAWASADGAASMPWLSAPDNGLRAASAYANLNADNQCVAAVDNALCLRLACAGALPSAIAGLDGTTDVRQAVAAQGPTLIMLDTSGDVTAASPAPDFKNAVNIASLSGIGVIAAAGRTLLAAGGGGAQAVGAGVAGAFASAVSGLSDVAADLGAVDIGSTYAVFLHTDGSVSALKRATGDSLAGASGWAGVSCVATSGGAVAAINAAGELLYAGTGLASAEVAALNAAYRFSWVASASKGATPAFIMSVSAAR